MALKHCIISYKKRIASLGSMQDTGCLGLVHWDDPEGWHGEGGGRGVQDWEHVYTHGGFMFKYGKPIQYCKVKKRKKKISELLRSSKQCPGCFACSSSFNQKENLRVRCYQHSHFIDEDTEAQRL